MCESFVPTGFRHTLTHTICVHPLYPLVSLPPPTFSPSSHLYRWSDKTTTVMDVLDYRTFPTSTFGADNWGRGATLLNQGLVGGVTISRGNCHGIPIHGNPSPLFTILMTLVRSSGRVAVPGLKPLRLSRAPTRTCQDPAESMSCNVNSGGDGWRGTCTDLGTTGGGTDHTRSGDTGGGQTSFVRVDEGVGRSRRVDIFFLNLLKI